MYFKLVRCYPRKEQYGDTLQLCKHCHILSWKVCVSEVLPQRPSPVPKSQQSQQLEAISWSFLSQAPDQREGKTDPAPGEGEETFQDHHFLHLLMLEPTHLPILPSLCAQVHTEANTQLLSFLQRCGILERELLFWGWAMPRGAKTQCDTSGNSKLTIVCLSRALTIPAQPTTQRAAPFHFHPRTLSTCSSSESQHMTTLQQAPCWLDG